MAVTVLKSQIQQQRSAKRDDSTQPRGQEACSPLSSSPRLCWPPRGACPVLPRSAASSFHPSAKYPVDVSDSHSCCLLYADLLAGFESARTLPGFTTALFPVPARANPSLSNKAGKQKRAPSSIQAVPCLVLPVPQAAAVCSRGLFHLFS